jgi:hypothetical protein
VGINYQSGAGNNDMFNVQFQCPLFLIKGSKISLNNIVTPIAYLSYGVPTTNSQMTHPMEFVADYFGVFQINIIDLSTNMLVANIHFTSCIINLDITPFNPNRDHLE